MSRGLGRIQRAVIAELIRVARWRFGWDVDDLAAKIYKKQIDNLTPTQINVVHRAVKGLAVKKLIEPNSRISERGKPRWVLVGPVQKPRAKKSKLSVV